MREFVGIAISILVLGLSQPAATQGQRFPPLRYDQLTPEQKKWADDIAAPPRNAKFTNPSYSIYIRSPELAARATAMSDYLRWNGVLPARLSEFAILITAREWTQQFEWHQHYPLAVKGDLDPKILADMIAGRRPSVMEDDERTLYDFAIQLYRDKSVSDVTYNEAVSAFGEKDVVDLIGILGYYDLVSMALIASKFELPADDVPRLQPIAK